MWKIFNVIVICSVLCLISIGNGERTKDKMYEKINTTFACFRRMNGTHQTGCASPRAGSTGVIHFVVQEHDIDDLLKNGKAGKYIIVMPTRLFTKDIAHLLKSSSIINGIMLYKSNTTVNSFSHEKSCPNENYGLKGTCDKIKWNKDGTGLMHEDFPFPIFLLTEDDDVKSIQECYKKFNEGNFDTQNERSLCSLELASFMYAAVDTPTCLRRSNLVTNLNPVKVCDPMGDKNVWASLYPIHNDTKSDKNSKRKYIVLAARLDTTSLFTDVYPGAVSPLTGLVSLLTTASLMKEMMPKEETGNFNLLYILFNGESYDYIGSERLVYDMELNEFPIKLEPDMKNPMPPVHLEDIHLFVELSQLNKVDDVYVHGKLTNNSTLQSFMDKLQANTKGKSFNFNEVGTSLPLPPASLQSFVKQKGDFPGMILADHSQEYANKFYNSIYDEAANIDYVYGNMSNGNTDAVPMNSIQYWVQNVSSAIALSLYTEITGTIYTDVLKPKVQLVDELFHCYLQSANCKIHKAVYKKSEKFPSDVPFSLYVGVTASANVVTDLTGLTLAWLTGESAENRTESNCTVDPDNPIYQYFWMSKDRSFVNENETECVRTTMNFTFAVSPAFVIEDYDWKSGKYSSWSESSWQGFSVRMFLKPSATHEAVTLATGSTVMVLSMIVIYFVKSRAHILFAIPAESTPTSC